MLARDLEEFIDELIRIAECNGYNPTIFKGMRAQLGTVQAISKLVVSGEIQYGFKRLRNLNLLDWSIEAAVLRFPECFSREVRAAAEWRLHQARH